MRKRYTRKHRHWSPRFKWKAKDLARLVEFEREWKRWWGRSDTPPDGYKGW